MAHAILSVIQIGSSNNPLRDLFVVRYVPTPTSALVGFGGIYHVQISHDFLIFRGAYVCVGDVSKMFVECTQRFYGERGLAL